MSNHDEPSRITVSRDALRADLAEMELRLRLYFDEQLRAKASAVDMGILMAQMNDIRRGEFTDAHKRAVQDLVVEALDDHTDRGWTNRQRIFGVIAIMIAAASFSLTIFLAATAKDAAAANTPIMEVHDGG